MGTVAPAPAATGFLPDFVAPAQLPCRRTEDRAAAAPGHRVESHASAPPSAPSSRCARKGCNARSAGGNRVACSLTASENDQLSQPGWQARPEVQSLRAITKEQR